MDENLGASFSIDVTDLKAGLAQANRMIRESESEFKSAAAGMDDWSNSSDGINARIKHLNTSIDLQNKKVSALQNEYDRLIAEGLDPASRQAVELRTRINKETEALNKNEKELREQTSALSEVADAEGSAADGADDTAKGFEGLKGAGAIAVGAIAAVAAAAAGAVGMFLSLAESTREFRTELANMKTNADQADVDLEKIKDKISDVTSVTGDSGAAIEGLNMLMATGLNTDQIDYVADSLTAASQKFDGLNFESLSEALQETMATGTAAGGFSEMIERMGLNLDDFNAGLANSTTAAEKQNYIMDFLASTGLKEVNDEYKENNKNLVEANKAAYAYEEQLAKLGDSAEPLSNAFTNMKTKVLASVTPMISEVANAVLNVINNVEGSGEQLTTLLGEIGNKIFDWLTNGLNSLITKLGESLPTILPMIAEFLGNLVVKILEWLPNLTDAALTLLGGLIDAIPPTIQALLKKLPDILNSLMNWFKKSYPSMLKSAIDMFFSLQAAIPEIIPELVKTLWNLGETIIETLMDFDWAGLGLDIVEGILKGMVNVGNSVWNTVKNVGSEIVDGFKSFFGIHSPSTVMADTIGKNLALGIGEGFEDNIAGINDAMTNSVEINPTVKSANGGVSSGGGVTVYQTNNYSQAHSRYEIYKSKQQTAAAVRLAIGGV